MIEPRSAYELLGAAEGEDVFVVAPGPSLDDFPLQELNGRISIAVNATLEVWKGFSYWMYADKRFSRLYRRDMAQKNDWRVVMPAHQARRLKGEFGGRELYEYHYQIQLRPYRKEKRDTGLFPYWFDPERIFVPGRASVASNATSLAYIMGARRVVLVGVDFSWSTNYYTKGVERNHGAPPEARKRVVRSGLKWYRDAMKHLWPGLLIVTVSPVLPTLAPEIPGLSIEEALCGARA